MGELHKVKPDVNTMTKSFKVGFGEYKGKNIEQVALSNPDELMKIKKFYIGAARKLAHENWANVKLIGELSDAMGSRLERICGRPGCTDYATRIWIPYSEERLHYRRNGESRERDYIDYNFDIPEIYCKIHRPYGTRFKEVPLNFKSVKEFSTKADQQRMRNLLLELIGFYEGKDHKRRLSAQEARVFFEELGIRFTEDPKQLELF